MDGNPLQYSGLQNPMDREAWQATVYGVTRVGHDSATNHQPLVTEGVQAESLGGQPKTAKQVGTALGASPPQTGSLL